MNSVRILFGVLVLLAGLGGALAQTTTEPTPTAETTAKPASEPEVLRFSAWVERMMEPVKVPIEGIRRIDDRYAYPHKAVNWKMEIVKEEGDFVWLRMLPPEDPDSQMHKLWRDRERNEVLRQDFGDLMPEPNQLDFYAEIVPPPSMDTMRFEAVVSGLPQKGRWQMNFVFEDMNGDGVPDLLLPPPRLGSIGVPTIFLGDGKGGFSLWREARWPGQIYYDHGAVAVADFDRDGHLDVVLAVHLKAQWLCFGNGKGDFSRVVKLPIPDPRQHSRAVAAGDFNQDGWPDIAFLAEIDYDISSSENLPMPTIWVLANLEGKDWAVAPSKGLPAGLIGSRIIASDVNCDGKLDLITCSSRSGWRDLIWLNEGDWRWGHVHTDGVLSAAYHFDLEPLSGNPAEGVPYPFTAAIQQNLQLPNPENPLTLKMQSRTGVVRYDYSAESMTLKSAMLVISDDQRNAYWRVASGDIDGDGRPDIVCARRKGQVEVYLQQPSGSFMLERSPELANMGRPFFLAVRDIDGNGTGDIIAMGAPLKEGGGDEAKEVTPGGFAVYLSRPGA